MSQRVLLLLLVPTLAIAMVGVGVAASRSGPPADPVVSEPVPPVEPVERVTDPVASDPLPVVEPEPGPTAAPEAAVVVEAAPPPPPPAYDVAAVQQRLTELRYYVAPIDGVEGAAMRSAVMAFQKVNGLVVDGAVGDSMIAALGAPAEPVLRGGPADRIEIDLNIQVLHLVLGGELARIMPVSSGNGASYTASSGGRARSLTPVGHFTIERRIRGVRKAPLGTLYDPLYFYRGWAIHGSNSVPAHPASHGCVRVPRADAVWLFDRAPNGMSVSLYGGQHTFPAGSAAPGTDDPAGDVEQQPTAPSPEPEPPPAPPSPEPIPVPTEQPSPEPEPGGGGLLSPVLPAPDPDDTAPPDPPTT